jgi:hypothetical protein
MGRRLDRRAAAQPGLCRSTKSSRTCGAASTQLSPRGIHRCLRWHGLSARLAPQKARVVTFQTRRSGRDIDLKYLPPLNRQRSYAYVAIDRATRFVYLEILPDRRAPTAAGFLAPFPT